jgi:DNA-binding GntR family transcriptional regulator
MVPIPRLGVVINQSTGTIGAAPAAAGPCGVSTLSEPTRPPSRRELAELGGIFRMRRLIEPELCAQACLLHTDANLDELAALAPNFTDTTRPPEEIFRAHRDFHFRLLAPAATAWDFRVLLPLWEEADRCVRALLDQLGLHPARLPGGAPPCAELLEAFRARDPEVARAASRRHLDLNARRVREFLTRPV